MQNKAQLHSNIQSKLFPNSNLGYSSRRRTFLALIIKQVICSSCKY